MLSDIEFRLRVRVERDSPEAVILNYLNSKQTLYPPKDMAMIALLSYWLPLAYRDQGLAAKENLVWVIRDSIYRLKLHLQYLQEMLGEGKLEQEGMIVNAKPSGNSLGIPFPVARAEDDSSPKPEANSAKPLTEQTQQQEWFNPMKLSSKSR